MGLQWDQMLETGGYKDFRWAQCQMYYHALACICLLYTSDAADERSSVDLGGRRIIKKKQNTTIDYRSQIKEQTTSKLSTMQVIEHYIARVGRTHQ